MSPDEALHHYFGFPGFRPGQDRIVESVLAGRDTLAIMPTGGGKSLCYQLPALLREGVTVVVSPLIALMKDQVDALEKRGIAATVINSSLTPSEQGQRLAALASGHYKLVYVAPERFRDRRFISSLAAIKVAFLAIDEAHCVSLWGHDFRPDYLRVGEAAKALGSPQIAAFTATATPDVRADICRALALRDPEIFITGFARPNLSFRVSNSGKVLDKLSRLRALIDEHKTGIIYCATRKRVEEVAEELRAWEVSHIAYHGGLDEKSRAEAQNRFIEGKVDVAVSTNAFGMGIDRGDLRFVAHYEMPGSVEAYYQEAGRAGRDGKPAVAEMLFGFADKRVQEFFIEGSNPSAELIRRVYSTLRDQADKDTGEVRISNADLAERVGPKDNPMAVSTALVFLMKAKVIDRFDLPGERIRGTRLLDLALSPSKIPVDSNALSEKYQRDLSKLQSVIDYGSSHNCRQQWILRYFGEGDHGPCGSCDHCKSRDRSGLRDLTDPEMLIVRQTLSGVARASHRTSAGYAPRFGRGRILEMLLGKNTAEVRSSGLDQLTTYGLLKPQGEDFLKTLFDELHRSGLLSQTTGEYPVITLTPLGIETMHDRHRPRLLWPKAGAFKKSRTSSSAETSEEPRPSRTRSTASAPSPAASDLAPDDAALFEKLRLVRSKLSKDRGLLPFQILTDLSLRALATSRPADRESAEGLPGIGPIKARTVVEAFLPVIAAHGGEAKEPPATQVNLLNAPATPKRMRADSKL